MLSCSSVALKAGGPSGKHWSSEAEARALAPCALELLSIAPPHLGQKLGLETPLLGGNFLNLKPPHNEPNFETLLENHRVMILQSLRSKQNTMTIHNLSEHTVL